jgi:hypothetical protein
MSGVGGAGGTAGVGTALGDGWLLEFVVEPRWATGDGWP